MFVACTSTLLSPITWWAAVNRCVWHRLISPAPTSGPPLTALPQTPDGPLTGLINKDGTREWLGVPFATPPGTLPWAVAVAEAAGSVAVVLNAAASAVAARHA